MVSLGKILVRKHSVTSHGEKEVLFVLIRECSLESFLGWCFLLCSDSQHQSKLHES